MTRQTSPEERQVFYRQHLRGETYEDIARQSEVSYECVRYWCRKQAKGQGVESQWHIPKRGELSQFDAELRERILALRDEHPRWGAISIRMELERDPHWVNTSLPAYSSIGRYLHSFPRFRRLAKKNVRSPRIIRPRPAMSVGRSISRSAFACSRG